MKIAVASSDGKVVNQHFGHAKEFYIFEKGIKDFKYIELRTCKAFCNSGEHDDKDLEDAIRVIEDCKYVLVNQVGLGAQQALEWRGIDVKIARGFINDCVMQLFKELT